MDDVFDCWIIRADPPREGRYDCLLHTLSSEAPAKVTVTLTELAVRKAIFEAHQGAGAKL